MGVCLTSFFKLLLFVRMTFTDTEDAFIYVLASLRQKIIRMTQTGAYTHTLMLAPKHTRNSLKQIMHAIHFLFFFGKLRDN